MDITVAKKDLLPLAVRMQGVAEQKATMPVLSQTLLSAEGGTLSLGATDLYLSLSGVVDATVDSAGSVAINAKSLVERVKLMPDGPIQITSDDRSATVKAKGSDRRYVLPAMPGGDFPPLPRPDEDAPRLSVPTASLCELIDLVGYAISPDESRAHLNSAKFEWRGTRLRMVATDGHRLSRADVSLENTAELDLLITLSAVRGLRRFCESEETVEITSSASSVFFRSGTTVYGCKQSDAQFPPYNQVIPQASEHMFRVPRAALIDTMRAVAVAAVEDTSKGVRWTIVDGKLILRAQSPNAGDASDSLPIEYDGKELRYRVHPKFLLDVLTALDGDDVILKLSGDLDPIVVVPGNDRDFLAVVMPMRLVP